MLQHNFDPIIYMVEPEQAKEYIKAMLDGADGFYYIYGEWKDLKNLTYKEIISCKFPMKIKTYSFVSIGKNMLIHYLRNYQIYFVKDGEFIKFSSKHDRYLTDYEGDYFIKVDSDDNYERKNN